MKINFSSKYEVTRAKLREQIRLGTDIFLEKKAEGQCYFCNKTIDDKMRVLMVKDRLGESFYNVDLGCYKKAKLFSYFEGAPFSMN